MPAQSHRCLRLSSKVDTSSTIGFISQLATIPERQFDALAGHRLQVGCWITWGHARGPPGGGVAALLRFSYWSFWCFCLGMRSAIGEEGGVTGYKTHSLRYHRAQGTAESTRWHWGSFPPPPPSATHPQAPVADTKFRSRRPRLPFPPKARQLQPGCQVPRLLPCALAA